MRITGRTTDYMETVDYKFLSPLLKNKVDPVQYFAEKFLRFVPRSIPNYPSHGSDHSKNIIVLLDMFLENWSVGLTEKETYLLYLAAWLHDIGIIVDRNSHNEHSANIINKSSYLYNQLGSEIQTLVGVVAKSHSKKFRIETISEEICGVRLRLICSIFRIIDACEVANDKCPSEVYECIKDELDEENIEFWKGHMSIVGITYKKPNIIFSVTDSEKSMLLITRLRDEVDSVKQVFEQNNIDFPVVQTNLFLMDE